MPTEPPQPPPAARRPRWLLPAATALVVGIASTATAYVVASDDDGDSALAAPFSSVSSSDGWKDCMGVSQKGESSYLYRDMAIGIEVVSVNCQGNKVQVKLSTQNWTGKPQDIVSKVSIANAYGCVQQTTIKFSDLPEEKDSGPVQPESNKVAGFATAAYTSTCDSSSGFVVKAFEATHADHGQPPSPTALPTPSPTPTPTPSAAPTFKDSDFVELEERDFKKMIRDPDGHITKAYKLYGYITQFDSATGKTTFRANIGASKLSASKWYDYDANAIFLGSTADLADVVEDDMVELQVMCMGSQTYSTTLGGSQTVPYFVIHKVKRYGTKS
ncbi:hypothetical protein ACFVFI_12590 [Streptomyces sp. NPDC057705]|uniref:hypothetical protein n=1 Tax=Streptomyces sp. NPDC057705 TaxID=3346222 RepID=UPI003691604A